jgi:uncharacterized membrane protein
MRSEFPRVTDESLENFLGNLLRLGVILAAILVLIGGAYYQFDLLHGRKDFDRRTFRGEPTELCSVRGIIRDAAALDSKGIIQLGLLLLIATPIARVVFSLLGFALEKDRTYFCFTLIVLGILIYSLGWGNL